VKTDVEELSPTRVRLSVEVSFEELKQSLDKAYKEVAQQARIPGFRPGKVPPRVIDMRIGRGAVLTEFPFGTPPLKRHFPERNRAIAWIAWATIVVEAARDSGSLITAGLAADEGRTVYAVPGPVGAPGAEGTNALLREGALVCRDASDVLEDLAPQLVEAARQIADARGVADAGVPGAARTAEDGRRDGAAGGAAAANDPSSHAAGLTPDERQALRHLPARGGIGIEALGRACGLPPGRLLAALLELELRGLVRQLPGRRFMSSG